MRRARCAPALALLAACAGGASDGTGHAGAGGLDLGWDGSGDAAGGSDAALESTTLRTWCRQSTQLMCDWMYRCFGPADLERAERLFGMTADSCAAQFDAQCQQRTMASVAGARQTYDGVAASACLAAVAAAPCDTLDNMATTLNPAVCDDVTVGLVERGGACTHTPDCSVATSRCVAARSCAGASCTEQECTGALDASAYRVRCATGDDCSGLLCVPPLGVDPGAEGVCSVRCASEAQCGAGANCVADGSDQTFCLAECAVDADCGAGLRCVAAGDAHLCLP